MPDNALTRFLEQQRLPADYLAWADRHFAAVIDDVVALHAQHSPVILGINGAQGSGKSTLAAYLQAALSTRYTLNVVCLSLDDFYLTKRERQALAVSVHPLLATRGVPGTHDVALALAVLSDLRAGRNTAIPRFDKALDDRLPNTGWDRVEQPVDVIILEGWCLGATPEPETALTSPINSLESQEDPNGNWRRYVNRQLATYQGWFEQVDRWVMLKAPDFQAIFNWRWQQEQKLAEKLHQSLSQTGETAPQGLMNKAQVTRFIKHYQRLTEHMLREMPARVQHLYQLDEQRQIKHEQHTPGTMRHT